MERSKYGQVTYKAEADEQFPQGCQCGNNGGGDCDWCQVYYDGPEVSIIETEYDGEGIPQSEALRTRC